MKRGPYACLDCAHCDVSMGSPAYSDVTPGEPARWECQKGIWNLNIDSSKRDVVSALNTGRDCPVFEPERRAG